MDRLSARRAIVGTARGAVLRPSVRLAHFSDRSWTRKRLHRASSTTGVKTVSTNGPPTMANSWTQNTGGVIGIDFLAAVSRARALAACFEFLAWLLCVNRLGVLAVRFGGACQRRAIWYALLGALERGLIPPAVSRRSVDRNRRLDKGSRASIAPNDPPTPSRAKS
jgi:hypothetical protein